MVPIYGADLAQVHHLGFGGLARQATPGILSILGRFGIPTGLVVDLACGSGILAAELTRAGYRVLGIDSSEAMIRIARATAPTAAFRRALLHETVLPPCDAVTCTGEGLNYVPPGATRVPSLAGTFRRLAASLRPEGLLIFDVIVRSPGAALSYRTWSTGNGWAVLVDVQAERNRRFLTREIITFRRDGRAYRRSHETHRVQVFDRDELERALRTAGFAVRVSRAYGNVRVPPRRLVFIAQRRARRGGRGRRGGHGRRG